MLYEFEIDKSTEFKFELYKNNNTLIAEIPCEFISNYNKSLEDINTFDIKIPKYITVNGERSFNRLYNKIYPKMQVVVTLMNNNKETKERYILLRKSSFVNEKYGYKEFTANSFEYTLKDKKMSVKGVYQLKIDKTFPANGIVDEFVKQNSNWKIGMVDNEARTEVSEGMEIVNNILFKDFRSDKIKNNSLLWEKDISTNVDEGLSVYLNIQYNNITTYSGDNKKLIENDNIYNAIDEPLPMNCKKVRAYHYNGVGNRYGIKYIFTLKDNSNVERICTFTNVINKSFSCDSITLNYETGKMITHNNVKFINLDTSDNWYDFLRDVETQFNCVFLFDTYNRYINVISYNTLGSQAPIELSFDSGIINLSIEDNDLYPNALRVIGKDNLSIASENIYGGEIIYNFDWYKKNIMSDELINKWDRYDEFLKISTESWKQLKKEYMLAYQRQTAVINEIKSLENQLKARKSLLAGYINAGDTENQKRVQSEIDELMKKVESSTIKLKQYTDNVQNILDDLTIINNSVKMENATDSVGKIFDNDNLLEINDIITIEEYNDAYYTTSYGLYNNSIKILAERIKPHFNFKISCANFINIINNPIGWNKVFKLGDWFTLNNIPQEILNDIGESDIRLVGYSLDVNKKEINNLEFTNKTLKKDYTRIASNIGKTANTVIKTSNTFGNIYEDAKSTINQTKTLREGLLDLASTVATNRDSSNIIDIGGYGAFFIDSTNQNNGLFITNSLICITQDNFKTCKTAISSDGIAAELLIGKEILGEKLLITNEKANFVIKGDGLYLYDGSSEIESNLRIFLGIEKQSNGYLKAVMKLIGRNSGQLVLSEDGVVSFGQYNDRDEIDSTHPMRIPFMAMEGTNRFDKIILNIYLDKFRATAKSAKNHQDVNQSFVSTQSGGGFSSAYTSSWNGGVSQTYTSEQGSWGSNEQVKSTTTPFPNGTSDFSRHYHTVDVMGIHTHRVNINFGSHSHSVSVSQPSHSHNIGINLDLSHNHELEYGIYEDTIPSNCTIKVNNQIISSGVYKDTSIDITQYIKINQKNIIEISSDTRGRVIANIAYKYLQQW